MQPGLVVKLRPAGPWRIGPDSGARNRVDFIYHSDSLYSAVTSAMLRMGSLAEWLAATAQALAPAVCFSSCFPFLDEIGFVVPPRTIWPPAAAALSSGRVRWKSARFVPLGIVQSLLSGQTLDENHWTVDGPSECLVPAGRLGPFRTSTRWSASVDRLSGTSERHSTACIEFRPGAGLWSVVSFQDDAARTRWIEPVKAAFRLLADTGFGGERSRGWGHAEAPEFIEGALPDMILPAVEARTPAPPVREPDPELPPQTEPEPSPAPEIDPTPNPDVPTAPDPDIPETAISATVEAPSQQQPLTSEQEPPEGAVLPVAAGTEQEPAAAQPSATAAEQAPSPPAAQGHPHWLLSLFTPAPSDVIDWKRGNYTVLSRGGRVESPAGSGELKKQLHMVAEGSVVFAPSAPHGSAPDVAPEGFAHPVFRAGFALAVPLPEVS